MTRAAGRFCTIGFALGLAGWTGCGRPGDAQPVMRVEPPPAPAPLNPAERRRGHDDAVERAVALAERGDYGTALGWFEKALEYEPTSPAARLGLGACYESIGDPVRAIQEYRRLLATNPADADAYANLGTSYIKLYHRERNSAWRDLARQAWEQSLRINPRQPDLRGYLASLDSTPAR